MTDPLHDFLAEATKTFGESAAIILDEGKKIDADVVPTGVEVVDNAIGIGGIPRGRITEVFGAEGCGKTTLCLHAMAQAQKLGQNVLFIDAEHALSVERLHAIGVDTSKMVFSQPDSGEQALDIVEMGVRSGNFSLIVVDSVAALVPQVEIEKDMGESVMGVHARLMSQAMRKLTAPVSKFNVALMFTNQVRTKIGGYVAGEETTGGRALKFYASLRLRMQYVGQIKNTAGQRISGKYKMTVVKNKLAVPFKEAEFEINAYGLDDTGYLIDILVDKAVLEKSGSWFSFEGEKIANGKTALVQRLHDEPELKTKLVQSLNSKTD
jgi:recombination protein RecA